MAAQAVGATTIVAIDIVPSRLEMAKELGATHVINSKQTNPVEASALAIMRRLRIWLFRQKSHASSHCRNPFR
jgi:Zn-dependent alcohol dehydrogenase